jgi:hypothetical protein
MSTKIKIQKMLNEGFSKKTLSKLTESQLNLLYKKVIKEATTEYDLSKEEDRRLYKEKTGNEVSSDGKIKVSAELGEADTVYPFSSAGQVICTSLGGNKFDGSTCRTMNADGSYVEHNFGNDKDRKKAAEAMGGRYEGGAVKVAAESRIMENKKNKKKNPWAICTATMGEKFGTTERSEWTKKQTDKYEKCVLGVKEKIKEGKNPFEFILEMKMEELVENALRPKMSKKDLLETIKNQKMISEDSKTKEKERTKEKEKTTTPQRRSPFKPAPNTDPAPKGSKTKEKERTKEKEKTTTPQRKSPFKPAPNTDPAPKGKLPNFLKFDTMNIKLKED